MNEGVFDSFPILNTSRLTIRQITEADDSGLLEVLSDEVTCKYLTHNTVNDLITIRKLINGMQRFFEEKQRIRWGIAGNENNNLIGHCGFFEIDKANCCAEISYCLKSSFYGNGIMIEALNEMLKFGFYCYGLNRIVANVISDNIGSIRVLQKLGFVNEGLLPEGLHKNGQSYDLIMFSILKSDFISRD
jgi:Acetyltransferases, including N-acetylases of ribosomal proteins